MVEQDRKSSRLTWAIAGTVVVGLTVVFAVLLVPRFEQAQLIDEIEAHGNLVEFETTFPEWLDEALAKVCGDRHNRMFGQITTVGIQGEWFGDAELLRGRGFRGANEIHIYESRLSGDGLESLGPNPNLGVLVLARCKF
ncbi:MAG: hypothetical protein WD069_16160, partial [Planctomycetales bacterium]